MGIFLDTTYRMHPDITTVISDNIYDGKLKSAPSTHNNVIKLPPNYKDKLKKIQYLLHRPPSLECGSSGPALSLKSNPGDLQDRFIGQR